MDVHQVIDQRRAYRSLEGEIITDAMIRELAQATSLAPSCFNNQPWRFVFVHEPQHLKRLFAALSSGNEWAHNASMIIAVFSQPDLDCQIKGRDYYLFDTGMAVGFLLLRATEMGLVAHPIAGYRHGEAKEILGIPENMTLITLVIVGKKSQSINTVLSEKQVRDEKQRPPRRPLEEIHWHNQYPPPSAEGSVTPRPEPD